MIKFIGMFCIEELCFILVVAGVVSDHGDHSDEDLSAICVIHPLDFPGINISGTIKLHQAVSDTYISNL